MAKEYKSIHRGKSSIVLGPASLNYIHLVEAYASDPKDEPKFSVQIRFPKDDKTAQSVLVAAAKCLGESQPKAWAGKTVNALAELKKAIHDGDAKAEETGDESYKGCWFINANSKAKPQVVTRTGAEITNPDEIHSGMIGMVSINVFAYNRNGKVGIGFGLGNVMKTGEGEVVSGRTSANADFGDLFEEPDGFGESAPAQAAPSEVDPFGDDNPDGF